MVQVMNYPGQPAFFSGGPPNQPGMNVRGSGGSMGEAPWFSHGAPQQPMPGGLGYGQGYPQLAEGGFEAGRMWQGGDPGLRPGAGPRPDHQSVLAMMGREGYPAREERQDGMTGMEGTAAEEFPALGHKPAAPAQGRPVPGPGSGPAQQQQQQGRAMSDGKYGLLSLLGLFRRTEQGVEQDLQALALGTDLTSLGMDLNASTHLCQNLASPYTDKGPRLSDSELSLPACYTQQAPKLSPPLLQRLPTDALLLCFYSVPQTEAQVLAADELMGRGFLYHRELKCWLCRVPDAPPPRQLDRAEVGTILFFDPASWEYTRRDNFTLNYQSIERRESIRAVLYGSVPE